MRYYHLGVLVAVLCACTGERSVIALQSYWWGHLRQCLHEAAEELRRAGCPLAVDDGYSDSGVYLLEEMPATVAGVQLCPVCPGITLWHNGIWTVYILRQSSCGLDECETMRRIALHELGHVCGAPDTFADGHIMTGRITSDNCLTAPHLTDLDRELLGVARKESNDL